MGTEVLAPLLCDTYLHEHGEGYSSTVLADAAPVELPDSTEPHFPVQVNFYFWLDDFLNLCALERYDDAHASLNRWWRHPSLVSIPRWEVGAHDRDQEAADEQHEDDVECEINERENGDRQADRCRRCLSAYAKAAYSYMAESESNAALADVALQEMVVAGTDVIPWGQAHTPGRGRIVVARRAIHAGEEISVERPQAMIQSRAEELVCPQCLRSIGTPAAQWLQLPEEGRAELPPSHALQECLFQTEPDAMQGLPVHCTNGSCDVMFCCATCEERAQEGHHGLLCSSRVSANQAAAYQSIVDLSNQSEDRLLLLAVHHTAGILAKARSADDGILAELVQEFVGKYHSEPWHFLAALEEDIESRLNTIKQLAALAEQLLGPYCDALSNAKEARELLLYPEAISRCVGMLQLVCFQAQMLSPLALALSAARMDAAENDDDEGNSAATDSGEARSCLASFACTTTGRLLARTSTASALVHFVSMCNHSCMPNLEIDFRHEADRPGIFCTARATRNIAVGEELNIQYIPVVAAPLEERQAKLLRTWGFKCQCTRCSAEEALSASDLRWFSNGCEAFQMADEEL
eukprot:TRINITY_DN63275_c0_g1_i1.p1 TRINITY_DN63275_c0_g1~~TRINITY_DN63275_c0_g1_i1.p1  ORF type:complete len:580 (-),score=90.65 TRINITY_DN63275_c0_g1_i1:71-1810(-)